MFISQTLTNPTNKDNQSVQQKQCGVVAQTIAHVVCSEYVFHKISHTISAGGVKYEREV